VDSYPPVHWEIFVMRLWREATSPAWRGQIEHLPDHQTQHFATLDQAMEFIARFAPGLESQRATPDTDESES
jgi:hypothetical protein